jgi:uncharacterized protein with PIN domain
VNAVTCDANWPASIKRLNIALYAALFSLCFTLAVDRNFQSRRALSSILCLPTTVAELVRSRLSIVGMERVRMHRCPQCRSERTRRSKRKGFVERGLLTLLSLRPFRCADCGHRFFRGQMIRSHFDVTDAESFKLRNRNRSYEDCYQELGERDARVDESEAFRRGYERGLQYLEAFNRHAGKTAS